MSYIRTKAFHGPMQEEHAGDQPLVLDGLGGVIGIPDVGGTVEIGLQGPEAAAGVASTAANIASITSAIASLGTAAGGLYFGAKDRKEARKDKAREEDEANAARAAVTQAAVAEATRPRTSGGAPKWVIPVAAVAGGLVILGVIALVAFRRTRAKRR
jgi:hypothetical protein